MPVPGLPYGTDRRHRSHPRASGTHTVIRIPYDTHTALLSLRGRITGQHNAFEYSIKVECKHFST